MTTIKLTFKPGINREGTSYSEEGGWYACDKVRFRHGNPESVGGWLQYTTNTFVGVADAALNWVLLNGFDCLAVGTNAKMYIEYSGIFYDITPIRYTDTKTNPITTNNGVVGSGTTQLYTTSAAHGAGIGDYVNISNILTDVDGICTDTLTNPFSTQAIGSPNVIVNTSLPHYASVGQTVTFSGASAVGGIIAANLNISATVLQVNSPTQYVFAAAANATSVATGGGTVTALYLSRLNGSFAITGVPTATQFTFSTVKACTTGNVNGGGTGVVAAFQISIGFAYNIVGGGWSSGYWSRNSWSSAFNQSVDGISMRIWTMDHYGQDLVYAQRQGALYYWSAAGGFGTPGTLVSAMPSANNVPAQVGIVKVTDERHVLAIGSTDTLGSGAYDPLLISWCDQQTIVNWYPAITNTAGSIRIPLGSYAVAAVEARQETLIWTNRSLHSLQFIGPPYTFDLQTVAANITICGPNAAINVNDTVYWMGVNSFWLYNGSTQVIPCTVRRYVFENLNMQQLSQVYAWVNVEFNEVTWQYPSMASNFVDSYVTYNYLDSVWTIGTTTRNTMTFCSGRGGLPYGMDVTGIPYQHEVGYSDGSTNPPQMINSYITSADFAVQEGDRLIFGDRVIPDMTFDRSTSANPQVLMTWEAKKFAGDAVAQTDVRSVIKTATVDQYTPEVWIRLRGRQFRLQISTSANGTCWLLGAVRINVRKDGTQ